MTKRDKPGASASPGEVRETAAGYAFEATSRPAEPARKKNLRLHQSKIDEARQLLGTSTETETIEAALDLVIFRAELSDGIRAMHGVGLNDVFDGAEDE